MKNQDGSLSKFIFTCCLLATGITSPAAGPVDTAGIVATGASLLHEPQADVAAWAASEANALN